MNKIDITVGVIILLFILWVLIEKNKTDNTKPVIGDNSTPIVVKSIGDCGLSNGISIGVKPMGDSGHRYIVSFGVKSIELPDKVMVGKETKMSNISGSSNSYLGLDTNKHNTK